MGYQLNEKRAIITGSTSGIGFAIAKKLAEAGATVLINGRTNESVQYALRELNKAVSEERLQGVAADLSTKAGINKVTSFWPEADILINNLGLVEPKPFFDITDEDWETFFYTNVMSAVRLSRHYAKEMKKNGWGRILFNASTVSGFFPGEMVHFGATKAALLATSRGLAESLADTGVTVNSFLPGPTKTEKVRDYMTNAATEAGKTVEEFESEMFSSMLPDSILKRFVEPEEIANLVVFLASEQSSAITGASMKADGGIVRSLF